LYLTGLTVVAPRAAATSLRRADVSVGGRYVWHGISRSAGLVAQPAAAVGLRVRRLSLESGAVFHYELDRASAGELSETGAGGRRLGEADLWGGPWSSSDRRGCTWASSDTTSAATRPREAWARL